ncbi:MAG: hypothetical protein V4581_11685 [Bacteroidota bacterium]
MKKILPVLVVLILAVVSCNMAPQTQTVKIENRYSLDLPDYLEKTTDLHDEASLQYQNLLKEFYVIVIDESKAEFNKAIEDAGNLDFAGNLEGYANMGLYFKKETVKFDGEPTPKAATINNLQARIVNINGTINNLPVYWKEAYIEGKNTYYQVIIWTLAEKKAEHEKDMQDIVNSFKEYDKTRK